MSGAKRKALQTKTAAEFFAENKHFAGFESPGKSLYTSLRELVENALDAAENIGEAPDISITIEDLSVKQFQKIAGLKDQGDRVDLDLYHDFHEDQAKAKKAKKAAASGKESPAPDAAGAGAGGKTPTARGDSSYFRMTVRDNGCGMKHEDIPQMFGIVLTGTKYGVKQTRGKFGLGSKMVLIWSKMSTGLPIEIRSARSATGQISFCKLDIDLQKNKPNILNHTQLPNTHFGRGSEISVTIAGNWTTYRARILSYLRQMAVITPYAHFDFRYVNEDAAKNFHIRHVRRSDTIPAVPKEVRPHPKSLNQLQLTQLISETRHDTIIKFLTKELSSINTEYALRIIDEVDLGDRDDSIKDLSQQQIHQLVNKLSKFKFDAPDGKALSPAGTYNLRLGIMKELHPDMVATHQDQVQSYEGHPVIVEAGIAIGGRAPKVGLKIYRFANRIPLLFQEGHDVVTQTAKHRIKWANYRININQHKVGVFVSICSTKIPFAGVNKEFLSDQIVEIRDAVKRSLVACCSQLKFKLAKQRALKDAAERKKNMYRFCPDMARALFALIGQIKARADAESKEGKPKPTGVVGEVLEMMEKGQVKEEDLVQKLHFHVDQLDVEQALQHVQAGIDEGERVDLSAVPFEAANKAWGPEMHSSCAVIKIFKTVYDDMVDH